MKATNAVPLLAGWFLVHKSFISDTYHRGRKVGAIDTESIIINGKQIAVDLRKALADNQRLTDEATRMGELMDQTQKDAYDLGYSNGLKVDGDELSGL